MRVILRLAVALLALLAIVPGQAAAAASAKSSPSTSSLARAEAQARAAEQRDPQLGSAIDAIASMTVVPVGFTTDAAQAVKAAEQSPAMQALHRRLHPLEYVPYVWEFERSYWYVVFAYHGKTVAEANVSANGHVMGVFTGPLAIAPYARGHYSAPFDHWWVIVPFALAFLLPFLDPRRWRRMVHLDALAVLSFLVSYILFDHAKLEPAVWLVYPPLVYLMVRMLWVGLRAGRGRIERLAPLLATPVLAGGLLILVGARIALSLLGHQQLDVGYASVVGAHRIALGLPLYFNDAGHGDTYGPITYLAYLPFERLWPWLGPWSKLTAATAAATTFDVLTIGALVVLGRRLRSGREGLRLGLAMAWGWAACPLTLLALIEHTNDGLIALLSVIALIVFASPLARGAVIGLATAAKFSPAALLPLFAAPRARGWRAATACAVSCAVVVAASILAYLPPGGLTEFYDRTLRFQMTRPDVFSAWALHPSLHPLQTVVEVLAVGLVLALAFVPKTRSLPRVCALAAAVTIAVQLPAVHWFYYYVLWFLPFILVVAFARDSEAPREIHLTAGAGEDDPDVAADPAPAPVLVGV